MGRTVQQKEEFNDLMMHHLDYSLYKQKLHQNAWICTPKMDKIKISQHLKEIKTLKMLDFDQNFDVSKICKGMPNGLQIMKIAKEFESQQSEFSIGNRTLMDLPINDTIYPMVMAEFIDKYFENNSNDDDDDKSVVTEYVQ